MTSFVRKGIIVCAIILASCGGWAQTATFDPSTLDKPIDITLSEASMADAIHAISKLAEIQIAGVAEPEKGISLSLKQQPVHKVLDFLTKATHTEWEIVDGVVVLRASKEPESDPADDDKPISPAQGMASFMSSLDQAQLYRLSGGFSISYGEMSSYQQDVLKRILSPPIVGVTETGEIIRSLPSAEQSAVSFFTLPYLLAPDADGKEQIRLRLDSMPYITLREAGK